MRFFRVPTQILVPYAHHVTVRRCMSHLMMTLTGGRQDQSSSNWLGDVRHFFPGDAVQRHDKTPPASSASSEGRSATAGSEETSPPMRATLTSLLMLRSNARARGDHPLPTTSDVEKDLPLQSAQRVTKLITMLLARGDAAGAMEVFEMWCGGASASDECRVNLLSFPFDRSFAHSLPTTGMLGAARHGNSALFPLMLSILVTQRDWPRLERFLRSHVQGKWALPSVTPHGWRDLQRFLLEIGVGCILMTKARKSSGVLLEVDVSEDTNMHSSLAEIYAGSESNDIADYQRFTDCVRHSWVAQSHAQDQIDWFEREEQRVFDIARGVVREHKELQRQFMSLRRFNSASPWLLMYRELGSVLSASSDDDHCHGFRVAWLLHNIRRGMPSEADCTAKAATVTSWVQRVEGNEHTLHRSIFDVRMDDLRLDLKRRIQKERLEVLTREGVTRDRYTDPTSTTRAWVAAAAIDQPCVDDIPWWYSGDAVREAIHLAEYVMKRYLSADGRSSTSLYYQFLQVLGDLGELRAVEAIEKDILAASDISLSPHEGDRNQLRARARLYLVAFRGLSRSEGALAPLAAGSTEVPWRGGEDHCNVPVSVEWLNEPWASLSVGQRQSLGLHLFLWNNTSCAAVAPPKILSREWLRSLPSWMRYLLFQCHGDWRRMGEWREVADSVWDYLLTAATTLMTTDAGGEGSRGIGNISLLRWQVLFMLSSILHPTNRAPVGSNNKATLVASIERLTLLEDVALSTWAGCGEVQEDERLLGINQRIEAVEDIVLATLWSTYPTGSVDDAALMAEMLSNMEDWPLVPLSRDATAADHAGAQAAWSTVVERLLVTCILVLWDTTHLPLVNRLLHSYAKQELSPRPLLVATLCRQLILKSPQDRGIKDALTRHARRWLALPKSDTLRQTNYFAQQVLSCHGDSVASGDEDVDVTVPRGTTCLTSRHHAPRAVLFPFHQLEIRSVPTLDHLRKGHVLRGVKTSTVREVIVNADHRSGLSSRVLSTTCDPLGEV